MTAGAALGRIAGGPLGAMLRLALRNVLRQRARSATALVAIVLGVAAVVIAGGFVADVYVQFGEAIIHSQYGHLQVHRSGFANEGTQRPAEYIIEDSATALRASAALQATDFTLSRLKFTGLANAGGNDLPILAEGVEPAREAQLGSYVRLVSGRALRERDADVVMIGEGVAKALRIAPGASLNMGVVTREGAMNSLPFEVVGVFRSYSKEFDERAIRLPLRSAQDLLATAGVNEIVVVLSDTSRTADSARRLREQLAPNGYEVHTWTELADFYAKTVQLFDREFGFLQGVLLVMILLSVWNTIYTSAFERLPEFGTMMALGDRRRDVFALILVESFLLGVVGSAIGVVIGMALAFVISAIGIPMPPPPNTDMGYTALIRVDARLLAVAFTIGTLAAMLAGLAPSLRISRTPTADALRRAR